MNDEARIRHELRHELRKLQDQAETDQAQPSLQSSVVAEQETPTNPSLKNVALKTHKTFMIKCNVEDCGAEYDSVEKFEEHTNEHVEDVSGILTFEKNSSRETKRTNSESLNAKKQKISE